MQTAAVTIPESAAQPMSAPPFILFPGEREVLESRPWMSTVDFAQQHFRVVTGEYAGQNFRTDILPYAQGIMDAWDDPTVREIIVCGTSQTGKTTIALACLASAIWREPGPAAIALPDEKTLARQFEEKVAPHFRRSPALRAMLADVPEPVQRAKILGRGFTLHGIHMGSEASRSSITIKYLGIDEEDAVQDKEAVNITKERCISYAGAEKIIRYSKPRGEMGEHTIWEGLTTECQTKKVYYAMCPACRTPQEMVQEQIRIPKDVRDPGKILHQQLARYECIACKYQWNDYIRDLAVRAGHWHAEKHTPGATVVGFHMPSWISPFVSLSRVMRDYMLALADGSPLKMRLFDNGHKAMPRKAVTIETGEDRAKAMQRPDMPPLVVPPWTMAVTCGIDVQMTGYWFVVRAFGRAGESALVQYGWLHSQDDVKTLVFETEFPMAGRDDVVFPVWRAGIDIGGTGNKRDMSNEEGWSKTEEVKLLLMDLDPEGNVLRGVKGSSRPMDVMVRASKMQLDPKTSAKWQEPLPLMIINTVAMKDLIHLVRLNPKSRQPMWLHSETDDTYLKQLTAEQRIEASGKAAYWEAGRRANHLGDCEVYAAACAHPDWPPALATLGDPAWRRLQRARPIPEHTPGDGMFGGRLRNPGRINPWAR